MSDISFESIKIFSFTHPTNEVFDIDPKRDAELKPAVDCFGLVEFGCGLQMQKYPLKSVDEYNKVKTCYIKFFLLLFYALDEI